MALSDISSVFSRYFVVGFFLPAYTSLVALWFFASSGFVPNVLQSHSEAAQLLILGGVAIVVGLVLSGLSRLITRFLEGYPFARLDGWPILRKLPRGLIERQRRRYDRLLRDREDPTKSNAEQAKAAWQLDQLFPKKVGSLLPTRLGNAMRAFEQHSNVRWGLDGVTIWPRIELLLNADEKALLDDARSNVYVFINGTVGAFVVGVCLTIDKALNVPHPGSTWPLYVIPFVLSYLLYRASIGPAVEWGTGVRASIDLHRLEVYERLGIRAPTSFTDERSIARRVNQTLLYGEPLLPDVLWREPDGDKRSPQPNSPRQLVFALFSKGVSRES